MLVIWVQFLDFIFIKLSMLMWTFIVVTVCVFYEWKRSCVCFFIVYICLAVGYPIAKRGMGGGFPLSGLTPPYFCFWPDPWTWISYVTFIITIVFILNGLR